MAINNRYEPRVSEFAPQFPIIQPFHFLPNAPEYHQEEWREITDWVVPGVCKGMFFISTHGRVWSNMKSSIHPNGSFKSTTFNQKGYLQVDILLEEFEPGTNKRKRKCCKVHRLVMLAFAYFPGCELLEVDHIDDIKTHNWLWNLQWLTPRENINKIFINGRRNGSPSEYDISPELARNIFNEAIDVKYSSDLEDIADKYNVSKKIVGDIRRGTLKPAIRRDYIRNGGIIFNLIRDC